MEKRAAHGPRLLYLSFRAGYVFLYHLDVFLQAVGCRGDFAGRKNEISRKLRPNGFSHK